MSRKPKKWIQAIGTVILSILMIMGMIPINEMRVNEINAATLSNPRIEDDSSMESKQKVTWDCIWFGSYPQTEIVDKVENSGSYETNWEENADYEIDVDLYNCLKTATYNNNDDTEIAGYKYKRLKIRNPYDTHFNPDYYHWSDPQSYHYFRYEPMKWRVLKTDDDHAIVLSDIVIDAYLYDFHHRDWESCTIKQWLNNDTFARDAFTEEEKEMMEYILLENDDNSYYGTDGGNASYASTYLLSESDVCGTDQAHAYGFAADASINDEGRKCKSSMYAKARGLYTSDQQNGAGNCKWWLRSPGMNDEWSMCVDYNGIVDMMGDIKLSEQVGVRPAFNLNLSHYTPNYAGTVESNGTIKEVDGEGYKPHTHIYDEGKTTKKKTCTEDGEKTYICEICGLNKTELLKSNGHVFDEHSFTTSANGVKFYSCTRCGMKDQKELSNPTSVKKSTLKAGKKVTWDCIWFGSYPQTEIVAKASECGTSGKPFEKKSDYVVDSTLYNRLAKATGWDSNGDLKIDGTTYRRIKKSNATLTDTNSYYYDWGNSSATYHYFRYDPIKWRVLNVDGVRALLLSDITLDEQKFNSSYVEATWKDSTIRSWLNGYNGSENVVNTDFSNKNFIDASFTSNEQNSILKTNVDNMNEASLSATDKLFLLGANDLAYTDLCDSYGFSKDRGLWDEARQSKSSTFAKAMGANGSVYEGNEEEKYIGKCSWWLRSYGDTYDMAKYIYCDGFLERDGTTVTKGSGVRPALTINLLAGSWSHAGTVSSDDTKKEIQALTQKELRHTVNDSYGFANYAPSYTTEEKTTLNNTIAPKYFTKIYGATLGQKLYENCVRQINGLCFGINVTEMMSVVCEKPKANSYGDSENVSEHLSDIKNPSWISDDTGLSVDDYIKYAFVTQISEDFMNEMNANKNKYKDIYDAIKSYVDNKSKKPILLCLEQGNEKHTVWVVGIGKDNNSYTEILVLDSNQPNVIRSLYLMKKDGNYTSYEYTGENGTVYKDVISYCYAADLFDKYWNGNSIPSSGIAENKSLFTTSTGDITLSIDGKEYSLNNDKFQKIEFFEADSNMTSKTKQYWMDKIDNIAVKPKTDAQFSIATNEVIIESTIPAKSEIVVDQMKDNNSSISVSNLDAQNYELSIATVQDDSVVKTTISGNNTEALTIEKQEEGIVLSSEENSSVLITTGVVEGEEVVDEKEIEIETASNPLLIEYSDNIIIKEDTTGDGVFDQILETEEHVHEYGLGTVKENPTCTKNGIKLFTCSCGKTKEKALIATGHSWNRGEITEEPKCGKSGTRTYTCAQCNETRTEEIAASSGHVWDDGKITKEATCSKEGAITYTCKVCGEKDIKSIDTLGHSYMSEYTVDKKATIDSAGSQSKHCKNCSSKIDVKSIARISSYSIYKGKTATFPTSAKASAWKTSNKKYVTVTSKGVINGVKKGSATITATIGGKDYTCKVTVKNCTLVVNKTKVTISKGKTYKLTAKATPEAKVTWSTSKKTIATVDAKGKVTAKKKGKCYIYAKANGVKTKVTVTVK